MQKVVNKYLIVVSRPDNFACGYLIYQFPSWLSAALGPAGCCVIWEGLNSFVHKNKLIFY